VKLLRVIQERQFERVGGERAVSVDVRVIAATNRNLPEEIAAGRFREDLFYRLNVFPISLPRLIDRREAILPLAGYFIDRFAAAMGKEVPLLTDEAQRELAEYSWPGNIRELQNVMERAMILARERLEPRHLNLERPNPPDLPDGGILKASEVEAIRRVLTETGGNRKETARRLGISLRTLQYRIRELGL
jgi:DNA-binding NtrC family response regulator